MVPPRQGDLPTPVDRHHLVSDSSRPRRGRHSGDARHLHLGWFVTDKKASASASYVDLVCCRSYKCLGSAFNVHPPGKTQPQRAQGLQSDPICASTSESSSPPPLPSRCAIALPPQTLRSPLPPRETVRFLAFDGINLNVTGFSAASFPRYYVKEKCGGN